MELKEFVSIPEYPEYLINKLGQVYSTKSNKILKNRVGTHGYLYIKVCYNNKTKDILIHRALCRVFKNLPSLDSELEVDHQDRDKLNIELDNLNVLSKEQHKLKSISERGQTLRSENKCIHCTKTIEYRSTTCKEHRYSSSEITLETIEYWVIKYSWSRASKELGLSDNGLRKRYKTLSGKDPKLIKQL